MRKAAFACFFWLISGTLFAQQVCPEVGVINVYWDSVSGQPNASLVTETRVSRRDGTCSASSAFNIVHSGPPNVLTFSDANVTSGQTYCYVAFNYAADGTSSAPSNPAECTMGSAPPTIPGPSNLRFVP